MHIKKIFFILSLNCGVVFGVCQCLCVDGSMQAICDTHYEVRPICQPRVCPIVPPSVRPIQTPTIPPVGTISCRQAQVYNESTNKYEWQNVCE